jgi:hypothetical protein
MIGISQPQTLKVYGYVKKTKVTLFIDSGSSHKFIYTNIARKLNICIHLTSEFQFSIPGNRAMSCDGKCHKVEISMSEYKLKYPMYVMPVEGVDIVLGVEWLDTLSTVGLNLQEKFIRFYQNGEKYKLHGINCPPPQIGSSNKMEKIIKNRAQDYFLHCYAI